MVVANIQQFDGANNRWYEKFPRDYFTMILWMKATIMWPRHGSGSSSTSRAPWSSPSTTTPMRSDGQQVMGKRLYAFSYTRSMMMGFIAPLEAVFVRPEDVTFTAQGETRTLRLDEVLEMREHDWFSRGIALSETCNRHNAAAAVLKLREVRRFGTPRQIIAVACSVRHAEQVAELFREHGLHTDVLYGELAQEKRQAIEAGLRTGLVDVVVQVRMLEEGYDLGTLSVAAVFRPYRSLSPYIQFIGRVLRLAEPRLCLPATGPISCHMWGSTMSGGGRLSALRC
jgi:superfamily II DNA or RNA helicase